MSQADHAQSSVSARWRKHLPRTIMMVGLLILMSCIGGFIQYATPLINSSQIENLKFGRQTYTLMMSGVGLFAGFFGLALAFIIRRTGATAVLAGAATCQLLCSLAMTQVYAPWQAIALYVASSLAIPPLMLGAQTCVVQWFPQKPGFPLSIVLSGISLGGGMLTPLAAFVLQHGGGWRGGWLLGAGLGAIALLAALFMVRDGPPPASDPVAYSVGDAKGAVPEPKWPLPELIIAITYWCLLVGSLFLGTALWRSQGVFHFKDVGYAPSAIATSVFWFTTAAFCGKLFAGVISERVAPRLVAAAGAVCMGIGAWLVSVVHAPASLAPLSLALGCGFGMINVALPATYARHFGVKMFPLIAGLVYFLTSKLDALSIWLTQYSFDVLHTYVFAFQTTAAIAAVTAVALVLTPDKAKVPPGRKWMSGFSWGRGDAPNAADS